MLPGHVLLAAARARRLARVGGGAESLGLRRPTEHSGVLLAVRVVRRMRVQHAILSTQDMGLVDFDLQSVSRLQVFE